MKIAMVGTSSVGKTTLALSLAETLSLPRVAERSRTVIREDFGLSSPKEIDDVVLMKQFQMRIAESQKQAERGLSSFITDRCYIDYTAYASLFIHDNDWLSSYDRLMRVEQTKAAYDVVFYIPPTIPDVDDGIRYTGNLRTAADEAIREAITRWGLNCSTVEPLDRQERVDFCLDALRAL